MAVELTPFGKFTKWVIAPVIVGLIGFYVAGPRFGSRIARKAEALKTRLSPARQTEASSGPASKDTQSKAQEFRSVRSAN